MALVKLNPTLLCACVALSPCAAPAQEGRRELLAPDRLARLDTSARRAWGQYLAASESARAEDRSRLEEEARAVGRTRPVPAPAGAVFVMTPEMNDAWFAGPAARRLADHIVSFQTAAGGWSKRVDLRQARQRGQGWAPAEERLYVGTFDNSATTEHLAFLGRINAQQPADRYRQAFLQGIGYMLRAQYPNGCFPQVYPLAGGYHDAVTFNDDAMVRVLRMLTAVAEGEYGFVPSTLRTDAARTVQRGIGCILASQIVIQGRKAVWCAQHDPLTLEPVAARSYEHESLSGRESAVILDYLMSVESPSPELVQAVHSGIEWFRAQAILDHEYEPRGNLVARPGAGPIWARFYELGTNRPLFSDRDGIRRYDLQEVGAERRRGYLWYTDEPRATLRRYEAWAGRHPTSQ